MKQQISRMSPHQNAKVSAVLMALVSLIMIVPFALIMTTVAAVTGVKALGMSMGMLILFPVAYLVLGYIMTVIGCAIYNVVVKMTGGLEFDVTTAGV